MCVCVCVPVGRLSDEELLSKGAYVEELQVGTGPDGAVLRERVTPVMGAGALARTRIELLKLGKGERLAAFLGLLGLDPATLAPLQPSAAMLFCVALCYVGTRDPPLLHEYDVDAVLAHFALLPNAQAQAAVTAGEVPLDGAGVQLASLLASVLDVLCMLNEAYGFAMPISAELPWKLFDGRVLHASHAAARGGASLEKLCAGDANALEVARIFKAIVMNAPGLRLLSQRSTADELAELRKQRQSAGVPRTASAPALQKSPSGGSLRNSGPNSSDGDQLPHLDLTTPRSGAASRPGGRGSVPLALAAQPNDNSSKVL